ncbi:MAG: membrane protein insertion efficiency factor YidD [Eggerthellaceae bacterium]|nr:membrane protein insertion efficiency factor YidD [Eggerthellaceae bacterium]
MCDAHLSDTEEAQASPIEDSDKGRKSIPCLIAIVLIRFYQFAISPHLAGCCRFVPSCSSYGLQAFQKYGFVKGFKLTVKRLARCRPGGPYGYDPVP